MEDSTTLRWTTQGATSASINQDVGTVTVGANQSTSVSPDTDTTYTLTASDAENDTATETVTVKVKPKIVSFSTSSTTITKGNSTTLTWTTKGATSASINQDVGTVTVGTNQSTSVSPTATTTYTLTASDAENDTATATATVTVVDPPVIVSFSAKPSTITEGGSSTLKWTTTGATSASINQDVGTVTVGMNQSTSVSPTTSTTYTLTAKNSADTPATATESVAIVVNRLPPTAHLEADPTEFFGLTDPVTLYWSTTRATSAEIDNGVGSVTPVAAGSTTVYPESTTTYTLTATGPGGSATSSAEVLNVDSQRAITATLTADATTITRGGSTMLRWTTEGADRASLSQDVGDDIGSVAATELASGSRSVSPTATTKYTITATHGEGDDAVTATAAVTITVTQP